MKFWTTDHISNDNKIFMLFEEDPNPRVGHNKDLFLADILYHNHRGEDVFWVRVNDYNTGKQKKGDFSTLEDAKEFVYDVLDIEDDEDDNAKEIETKTAFRGGKDFLKSMIDDE